MDKSRMNAISIIIITVLAFVSELYSQSVETPGRIGVPNPEYLAKICKLLTNSTTLIKNNRRLYTSQRFLMWPEEVPQSLSSLFKFTKVAIDVAEVAVHGEFHLYQLSEHPEDLEFTVFRLNNVLKEKISSLIIDSPTTGWLVFDVSKLSKNLTYIEEDITLTVEAFAMHRSRYSVDVKFVRINDPNNPSRMPIYIHFLNGHNRLPLIHNRISIDVYEVQIENPVTEDDRETRCQALI